MRFAALVPKPLRIALRRVNSALRARSARRALARADAVPARLSPALLPQLQERYPTVQWSAYDSASTDARGRVRAGEVIRACGLRPRCGQRVLEAGCYDAMVSRWLAEHGCSCTAIDIVPDGFDPRASSAGVNMRVMDVENLTFESGAFDVACSFDALEHVAHPDRAIAELLRVVRPGGTIHLNFGPLYMSAFGLHADGIRVPYCQHLFDRPVLEAYLSEHGLSPLSSTPVNGWTLARYRALFKDLPCHTVRYYEVFDSTHASVIAEHPTCFAHVSRDIDEFLVAGYELTLCKPR